MWPYKNNRNQAVFLAVLLTVALSSSEKELSKLGNENDEPIDSRNNSSHREGKFVAVAIFRIPATSCDSFLAGFEQGYCDGVASCLSFFGAPVGFCPTKIGICCIVKRSCGEQLSTRTGYFLNRGFPQPTNAVGHCQLTINKYQTDVRQIRLDFIRYETTPPDMTGNCQGETLTVDGNDDEIVIPQICGTLTGQHIYINFGDLSNSITLTQTLDGVSMSAFNIRVTQFRTNSPDRAPDGCLQYFTEPNGVVSSLNFDSVTQHLSSQAYDICVRRPNPACRVTWTRMTYDINRPDPADAMMCNNLLLDYVFFPASEELGTQAPIGVVCSFPTSGVIASNESFIQVNFNANEGSEATPQFGFQLHYRVATEPCA